MSPSGRRPQITAPGRISWSRAAAERTSSQAGNGRFDIVHPEVVALGVRVRQMGCADLPYPVLDRRVGKRSMAQFQPIVLPTAIDDVIERGQGIRLVGQVSVLHGLEKRVGIIAHA